MFEYNETGKSVRVVDYDGYEELLSYNKPCYSLKGEDIAKQKHYDRNKNSYNENLSQEEWIKEYGEANIIRDAQNQARAKSPNDPGYSTSWYKADASANIYHTNTNSKQGDLARFNQKYLYKNADGSSYEVIIGVNNTRTIKQAGSKDTTDLKILALDRKD